MPLKEQQHSLLMPCIKPYRWELMHRHRKTRMQGWTSSLRRSRYLMVPNHPSVTHGWRRYMPCVSKQEGLFAKCCYVQVRLKPEAMDDQIKNDLITGYSDLQGLGCKQATYDNIVQRPDEPLRSYIMRDSRLFKLLNGTAPNDVQMRMMSMHFVNSLCNYLSSKVENRLLGMNERNYSLGDTFKVALECELKAIASEW